MAGMGLVRAIWGLFAQVSHHLRSGRFRVFSLAHKTYLNTADVQRSCSCLSTGYIHSHLHFVLCWTIVLRAVVLSLWDLCHRSQPNRKDTVHVNA